MHKKRVNGAGTYFAKTLDLKNAPVLRSKLISYIDFDEVELKLNFKKNKVNIPTIKRIVSSFFKT